MNFFISHAYIYDNKWSKSPQGSELDKLRALASKKFLKLLEIFECEKTVRDEYAAAEEAVGQEMMNITFVKRKFTARGLCEMLQKVARIGTEFKIYTHVRSWLHA
jgi:hypothetical protein